MFMSVTVTVPAGAWKTPVRVGSQTVIDAIGVVVLQVMPAADQLPLPPTVAPLPNQYRSAAPARPPVTTGRGDCQSSLAPFRKRDDAVSLEVTKGNPQMARIAQGHRPYEPPIWS